MLNHYNYKMFSKNTCDNLYDSYYKSLNHIKIFYTLGVTKNLADDNFHNYIILPHPKLYNISIIVLKFKI